MNGQRDDGDYVHAKCCGVTGTFTKVATRATHRVLRQQAREGRRPVHGMRCPVCAKHFAVTSAKGHLTRHGLSFERHRDTQVKAVRKAVAYCEVTWFRHEHRLFQLKSEEEQQRLIVRSKEATPTVEKFAVHDREALLRMDDVEFEKFLGALKHGSDFRPRGQAQDPKQAPKASAARGCIITMAAIAILFLVVVALSGIYGKPIHLAGMHTPNAADGDSHEDVGMCALIETCVKHSVGSSTEIVCADSADCRSTIADRTDLMERCRWVEIKIFHRDWLQ